MKDYTKLTDEELETQFTLINAERTRRQSLDTVSQEIGTVLLRARAQGILPTPEEGAEWEQPTGYHNAYMQGDIVTHDDKEWESLYNGNDQEPGVRGWREILQDNEDGSPNYPVWSQPQGYEEAYEPGTIVWHPDTDGQLYVNVHTDNNAWEPGTPGSQWEEYDPEDDNDGEDDSE